MSVLNFITAVTPPKSSGSGTKNPKYRTRWIRQAHRAIAKSKLGGYPDRRERRLIAQFKAWEASQRKQVQQSTQQEKVAA